MRRTDSNKARLFTRILPELAASTPYFSLSAVRSRLVESEITISAGSLRQYMSEAMEQGIVHDAGRGWYSRLQDRCALDRKPVAKLVRQLEKEFPLLDFTCWSTQQVNPWMHHILSKFIAFVNVDKDGLSAVSEFLRDAGYEVHANPTGKRAVDVRPNGKTVVIRPLNAHAPRESHFTPPEAILVDLSFEANALGIMGIPDYRAMLQALASSKRIAWGACLYYAEKRCAKIDLDFKLSNSLMAEKAKFCR